MPYNITIVRNSETLPSDGAGSRLWRSGIFSKHLHERKHNVSWIISSYDHFNRSNRKEVIPFLGLSNLHQTVSLIRTPGYKHNISFSRFHDHFVFGMKLFIKLIKSKKSDLIICSYPTPESSFFCVVYGLLFNVPVVIDIRDKWPDVFLESYSSFSLALRKILLSPYILMKKFTLKYSFSILAASPEFLNWGLKAAKRKENNFDFVSFIPFEIPNITNAELAESEVIFDTLRANEKDIVISFAGTLGEMFEFEALYEALKLAKSSGIEFKVLICGNGASLKSLKRKFNVFPEVYFTGHINSQVLFSLLKKSTILLAPYINNTNFHNHLPNKFMEYCAAGKPIVSSLTGLAEDLIKKNKLGYSYSNGDELFSIIKSYSENKKQLILHSKNASDIYSKMFHPKVLLPVLEAKLLEIIKVNRKCS